MKLKILLLLAVITSFAQVQAENCNAGIIRNYSLIASSARPLIDQGVDVRVVTVDHNTYVNNGSSLVGVETSKPTALTGLTLQPTDRAKNIFLGSYYAGAFDIPSTYSQLAKAKAGQWEAGIANTLNGTGARAIAYHRQQFALQQKARTTAPIVYHNGTAVQSGGFLVSGIVVVILVLVVFAIMLAFYFAFRDNSSSTTVDYTSDYRWSTSSKPNTAPPVSRHYAATAPSSTTVINNTGGGSDFVTGMLVGEALSRPSQPITYVEPSPAYVPEPAPAAPIYEPPVNDAPDSTWESPSQDTNWSDSSGGSGNNDSSF